MEAAAIPFPRPDRTPPVTIIYLVGISNECYTTSMLKSQTDQKFIPIRVVSQAIIS